MAAIEKVFFKSEAIKLRRQPQQKRAELTIERIREVALDLIVREGYSALTTNRIAQEAKVNISSLYQYYPNREAIVLAIYERAASELAAINHKLMLEELNRPLEIGLPRILKGLITYIETRQAIFLHLVNELPEIRQTAVQLSIENMAYEITHVYLRQHLPNMNQSTLKFKMFFCQNMTVALMYRYLLDKPTGISRPRFIAEMSRMVIDNLKAEIPR